MDVFKLRDQLIQDYTTYTARFIQIRDKRIHDHVQPVVKSGALRPRPLSSSTLRVNPATA